MNLPCSLLLSLFLSLSSVETTPVHGLRTTMSSLLPHPVLRQGVNGTWTGKDHTHHRGDSEWNSLANATSFDTGGFLSMTLATRHTSVSQAPANRKEGDGNERDQKIARKTKHKKKESKEGSEFQDAGASNQASACVCDYECRETNFVWGCSNHCKMEDGTPCVS